jgi:hypothetical protein
MEERHERENHAGHHIESFLIHGPMFQGFVPNDNMVFHFCHSGRPPSHPFLEPPPILRRNESFQVAALTRPRRNDPPGQIKITIPMAATKAMSAFVITTSHGLGLAPVRLKPAVRLVCGEATIGQPRALSSTLSFAVTYGFLPFLP